MFTGIIETTGKITGKRKSGDNIKFDVTVADKSLLKKLKQGDSIAVNGVCITVETHSGNKFSFSAVKETLSKTNFRFLEKNSIANLERAMSATSRFDGHFVQGHVDTTGVVCRINELQNTWEFFIEFSSKFKPYIINTGSITIDGISLTVAEIVKESKTKCQIKVAIIPHTYEITNMKYLKRGDVVNIEFDMIGKYIQRITENKR